MMHLIYNKGLYPILSYTCLSILIIVNATPLIYNHNVPSVIFGDVEVTQNCTHWKCDRIMCPNNTERCHVEKYKSPTNREILVRENICYSGNDTVLYRETFNDAIGKHETVKLKLDILRDGDSSSTYQLEHSYKNSYAEEAVDFSESDEEELKESLNEFENSEKEMENNLNMEFLNFDKIGQDVEEKVRRVNQDVENQLEEIRGQMARTFNNLFALG